MLFFHAVLTLFLLAVFYYDFTSYTIPNWICGILLALYPCMLIMTPDLPDNYSIWYTLLAGVGVFAAGVVIFALRWAGGGDVKLMTVLALWAGPAQVMPFLVYTGFLGGMLALLLVMVRPIAGRMVKAEEVEKLPRILRHQEPLPYGLAITTSFLIILWLGYVPGLPFDYKDL